MYEIESLDSKFKKTVKLMIEGGGKKIGNFRKFARSQVETLSLLSEKTRVPFRENSSRQDFSDLG
jgi:hypothetical protein